MILVYRGPYSVCTFPTRAIYWVLYDYFEATMAMHLHYYIWVVYFLIKLLDAIHSHGNQMSLFGIIPGDYDHTW